MNVPALIAVVVFAAVLLAIMGALYASARRSYQNGELEGEGLRVLRWAVAGQLALYLILAITAFLAPG